MQVMNFLNEFRAKFDHNWKFVWIQVNTLQEKTGDSKVQPLDQSVQYSYLVTVMKR